MLTNLNTAYTDTRAGDLAWALGRAALPALAVLDLEVGDGHGLRAQVELRLLGASHQVLVDAGRGECSETVACLPGSQAPLPYGVARRIGAWDYEFGARIETMSRRSFEARAQELLALVTSAIREASNGLEVLERIRERTGVELQVLSGEDEARLTFLAVRRWFGWSAGQLLVLDIGGGSLELAGGIDEDPDIALSLPLGAGRMTRRFLPGARGGGPPDLGALAELDAHATELLAPAAERLRAAGKPDLVAATSKTFRTLARLTGAAPSSAGLRVGRQLSATGLGQLIGFVSRIESSALAELPGVSPDRAHQVPAGAAVAAAAMRALDVPFVRICPWALREGVILRRLDSLGGV